MVDKDVPASGERNGADGSTQSFSDQEREWAQSAFSDFIKGNYGSCLQALGKLEVACGQDVKLASNKAVAEYYKSELRKTDQFKRSLSAIFSQVHMNIDDVSSLDDVENCILYYNQAVLLYHLKQYSSALRIISKVFSFIEPMEESLAQKVCLLMLELLLQTHQPEKALTYISYIEQQFVSTTSAIGSKLSGEKDIKALDRNDKDKILEQVSGTSDPLKLKLLQFRIRCYLKTQAVQTCIKEFKGITSGTESVALVLLKANMEYLQGNYRISMKVLNTLPENIRPLKDTGEHIPVLYYNNMGCLHHYMAKPNLSTFYLQKALKEEEDAIKAVKPENAEGGSSQQLFTLGASHSLEIKYNLGVALLHAGRPLPAFDYLLEAVQVFHMNPRLWLRLAECCIMVHKKTNSEDFNIAARRQDMVQGVIGTGVHKKIILSPQLAAEDKSKAEEVSSAIPAAKIEFAALCLRNAFLLINEFANSLKIGSSADPSQTTLRMGTSHLNNLAGSLNMGALGGLGGPGSTLGFGAATRASVQEACYGAPSSPLTLEEVDSLRCSVLADSAYVSLCLGDYIMALQHAQLLLKQPKLSGAHKLLGHLYAAEAFLMCNKISDAIEHLNPENVKDVSVSFAGMKYLDKEQKDLVTENEISNKLGRPLQNWTPRKLGTARAVLQYNLAVAFATRGELDKAGETLKKVFAARGPDCEVPIHVVMLALYLELQLGHSDVSRNIVKQHCPQFR